MHRNHKLQEAKSNPVHLLPAVKAPYQMKLGQLRHQQNRLHPTQLRDLSRNRQSTTTSHCRVTSPVPLRTMQHLLGRTPLLPGRLHLHAQQPVAPWRPSIRAAYHLADPMDSQLHRWLQRPTPKVAWHNPGAGNFHFHRTPRRRRIHLLAVPALSNCHRHSTQLLDKNPRPRATSGQTPSPASARSYLDGLVLSWVAVILRTLLLVHDQISATRQQA